MKWLPGGWQRADRVDAERGTIPAAPRAGTAQYTSTHRVAGPAGRNPRDNGSPSPPAGSALLGSQARDVDVSASSFRNFLVGGGLSGLLTVLCAAAMVNNGSSIMMWIWQLVFGIVFLWFLSGSRGMLASRGFLLDRSGFYMRTRGEVFGVEWSEIMAIGVGNLPWIEHRRPVNPERRQALEFFPSDGAFPDRHPELDRWLVEEPAPMPGLPSIRYRFHLPPLSRLSRSVEHAVQTAEPRKWVGHYRRATPPPHR